MWEGGGGGGGGFVYIDGCMALEGVILSLRVGIKTLGLLR